MKSEYKLKRILQTMPEIKLAYLIGSVSKKSSRPDSDLDIVMVVSQKDLKKIDYGKLYELTLKTINNTKLDLRIITMESNDPLFLFEVIKGRLIYQQSEKERVAFEKRTMLFYYDGQHLRDIFHHYLDKRIKGGDYGR